MAKAKPEPLESIRIGGHDYGIVRHDAYVDAHSDILGSVDCSTLRMILHASDAVNEGRQDETLIHEVLEALIYHMGVSPTAGFTFTHDHLSVLSEGLYQVLVDNPGFWRGGK
jgi:hypothetical protein